MATMTVAKLHKLLGEMLDAGNGRRPVCVNKASFFHPLESDGVAILDVTEAKAETITMADDDGWTATNKDGSEKTRKVFVLGGGHRPDEVTPNAEASGARSASAGLPGYAPAHNGERK